MKHSQCPFLLANKISCFAVRKGYILCPRTMGEFQPAALPSHSEIFPDFVLPTWVQPSSGGGDLHPHPSWMKGDTPNTCSTRHHQCISQCHTEQQFTTWGGSSTELAPFLGLPQTSAAARAGLMLLEVQLPLILCSCSQLFHLLPSFCLILWSIFVGQLFCTFLVWGTSLPEGNVYALHTQPINTSSISTPAATSYPRWIKAEITQKSGW